MLAALAVSVAASTLAYAVLHELSHAAAAALVGCRPRLAVSRDGVAPAPAVHVEGCRGRGREWVVLYAPYMVNVLLALYAPPPLSLIAVLTIPNAALEDERLRGPASLVAASLGTLALALAAGRLLQHHY